mgnify:CR=1 FL=1
MYNYIYISYIKYRQFCRYNNQSFFHFYSYFIFGFKLILIIIIFIKILYDFYIFLYVIYFVINYVHRLSDPRDPAYPFSDTYICSKCNERLSPDDSACDICNLYIHGEIDTSSSNPSTYPEPAPFNKSFIVDKANSTLEENRTKPEIEINPEVDNFIKSILNQSFAILFLITISILAFLYFDFTNIVAGFNQELIGN